MGENTSIEWATHTFNPWEGCQKVGPGCDHCYAETRNARFGGGVAPNWGPGAPRRRTSAANWQKPRRWQAEAAETGIRPRVFCASLADVFDNAVDPQWRSDLLNLICETPDLDWLLLTKRIGNVEGMLEAIGYERLPQNVWLGATIVNQEEADRDIPKLLTTPAVKHFLSMEPLLGPVVIRDHWLVHHHPGDAAIDWVIVGGESGPSARPMHPDWARSLRDQCAAAGVAFMFKQWGSLLPGNMDGEDEHGDPAYEIDDAAQPVDYDRLGRGKLVQSNGDFIRFGHKKTGRMLDGVEHNGMPV